MHASMTLPGVLETEEYAFHPEKVRVVLLRDKWHYVNRPTEKDRTELVKTLENIRRKCDALCRNKTDDEICADSSLREYIPPRQHPERLTAKPFRTVLILGEQWCAWSESQDPIPALMEILVPWTKILALEVA
jgi:hypothetical protein